MKKLIIAILGLLIASVSAQAEELVIQMHLIDSAGVGKAIGTVRAEGGDFRYETCFMLAHRVKAEEAKAKFEAGLMTIQVPFEETMRGHKVAIE
jgi:HSP20 family molecular chaperone IbpA